VCIEAYRANFPNSGHDVIAPVPLHRERLIERGFNQSALMARALGKAVGVSIDVTGLRKIRPTAPQARLTRADRANNVQNAFCVSSAHRFEGMRVLLLDDVSTTGATLHEAARTLAQGGAAQVDAFAAALRVARRSEARIDDSRA
jgi:ComF family protein